MGTTTDIARDHLATAGRENPAEASPHGRGTRRARGRMLVSLAGAAAIVVASAACGSDDDGTGVEPAPTESPAADDRADEATITIEGFSFGPPLEVPAGTTVRVINNDSDPHTWTATDGAFDSGSLSSGEEFTHTFDEPGEFEFTCAFHPTMTGTITVTP